MTKFKKLVIPLLLAVFALTFNINSASAATYADGEYTLPFTVLKGDSDERSMTNDYLSSPGKLIVKDGKNFVQLTLKNSSWWKEFKVGSQDVTVISEGNDTRVVQFEVQDLNAITNAKIHVIVPNIDYDNKYDIRFQFDASGIPSSGNDATNNEQNQNTGDQNKGNAGDQNQNNSGNQNQSNDNSTDGSKKIEKNPPTGDEAPILLLTVVLLASGFVVYRRVRVR
ncbi:heme uptake protein IsdC [Bacillus norwichensis]|uniref:Heme uptake protein IsdC n=1 Tax=Bacillus norwichensis TaxID=2762217 RepID=A0ABR8VHF1_9BACI|nr:heme uptake protein IsdC [Bacillus norwichensis]MBD8004170.1 heme uptake protein IsdC [Bacillus norwichensis]